MKVLTTLFEEKDGNPAIVHQFGKLMVGVIAGFAAKNVAERAYTGALDCYRMKQIAKQ